MLGTGATNFITSRKASEVPVALYNPRGNSATGLLVCLAESMLCELLQVFISKLWMMHYDHACPKRTQLWSSNVHVIKFDKGKLTTAFKEQQRKKHGHVQPVKKTINKSGHVGYSGTALLKGTQS